LRSMILKYWGAGLALLCAGCITPGPEESTVGDYLSGRLAARTNDVATAADAFGEAQTEAPGAPKILRDAFFFHLANGDFAEALPLAEKLAADPEKGDDGLATLVIAARHMKQKRYQSVREVLAEGVDADYFAATTKIIDAWALAGLQGADAAAERLAGGEDTDFRGFDPLHMALFAEQAGRADAAMAAHQLSIVTYGGTVGRSAYGAFLERSGDTAAAREYYDLLAQDAGPDRETAEQGLARLAAGDASMAFSNVSPTQGAAIALYTLSGAILQQTSNQRAAAERAGFNVGDVNYNLPLVLARIALYLDPALDDARRFAGSILNAYGNYGQAVDILSKVPPTSPYYELSRVEIAAALAAEEKDEEAIAVLRKAIRQNPETIELRLSLANLLASRERYREAVEVADALIARLPDEVETDAWRYFLARGAYHLELDNWPAAEKDLQRAVEIAPEEPTALNYLGYSWAERGLNLDEAFELIEKAVSLQPDSGAIIDSLGWAHYQLGEYDEAVGHLEQAAALAPDDPTVTEHLGDVYWKLGRETEARYQWRHALELEPSEKQAAVIEEKLEEGLPGTDE